MFQIRNSKSSFIQNTMTGSTQKNIHEGSAWRVQMFWSTSVSTTLLPVGGFEKERAHIASQLLDFGGTLYSENSFTMYWLVISINYFRKFLVFVIETNIVFQMENRVHYHTNKVSGKKKKETKNSLKNSLSYFCYPTVTSTGEPDAYSRRMWSQSCVSSICGPVNTA